MSVPAGIPRALLATAALLASAGLGSTVAPVAVAACPNESIRAAQDAVGLPDCRAYELVTPGAQVGQDSRPAKAATGGGGITFYTNHPAPDAASSSFIYLARRAADGWSSIAVGPQNAAASRYEAVCEQNVFFSPDLSSNVLEAGWFDPGNPAKCKRPGQPIVAGEPIPYRNVFVHDVATDSHRLVNVTPDSAVPDNAAFQTASDDLSRIVFGEEAQLTPEAPAGYGYYVWTDGTVRPLTYLPDGTTAAGELVEATSRTGVTGSGFAPIAGAMSGDGHRAFFYSGGALYLRENADRAQSAVAGGECTEPDLGCTVQVDASQGPGPDGGGVFWRATPDGATVLFTAEGKLTADSTAEAGKPDLYRFEVESGQLADLTVNASESADVRGVSGMSRDGSYLYFVANGALAPGAAPGDCPGTASEPGHCNLYLLHNGAIAFVATLSRKDNLVWQEDPSASSPIHKPNGLWANVSPNGRFLAFLSHESLTGYDNTDGEGGAPVREIYLYAAGADELSCVSCPPGPPQDTSLTLAAAGNYGPGASSKPNWMANAVLDDGSVFFDTEDGLLSGDVNGREDVYHYRSGELHLISPGNLDGAAHFLDASPEGTDVFFRTPQSLTWRDIDNENVSIYTAQVSGGFAAPPSSPPPCEADACRDAIEPAPLLPLPVLATVQQTRKKRSCRRANHHRKGAKRRDGGKKRNGGRKRRCAKRRRCRKRRRAGRRNVAKRRAGSKRRRCAKRRNRRPKQRRESK